MPFSNPSPGGARDRNEIQRREKSNRKGNEGNMGEAFNVADIFGEDVFNDATPAEIPITSV